MSLKCSTWYHSRCSFLSVLQGSSMPSLVVKELAIGSLFTGVLNVFLISFIGLLGKSNTTLQIWRVVQPNVPTINVVVDMVTPQRRIAKIIGGEVKDFSRIIEQAKGCPAPTEIESGTIIGGFAHEQVFALAEKVVDAVKTGAIRKFVAMAGCDGRQKAREYYKEFAERLPKDVVILTAGCANTSIISWNLAILAAFRGYWMPGRAMIPIP